MSAEEIRYGRDLPAGKHSKVTMDVHRRQSVLFLIQPSLSSSPNFKGHLDTMDDFAISSLHFPAVLHCPLALAKLQRCPFILRARLLPSSVVCRLFFPLSLCLARPFWRDLTSGKYGHTTTVCISLRLSRRFVCGPITCWISLGNDLTCCQ